MTRLTASLPIRCLSLLILAVAVSAASETGAIQVQQVPRTELPFPPEAAGDGAAGGSLPDGVVSRSEGNIRTAWLIGPTTRYAHGVLGDPVEASGLAVETASGDILSLKLPANEVFEDRIPRLVDLNGDGLSEILLVKTHVSLGARLVLVGLSEGRLSIVAESEPIGKAFRWLNPIGVDDFDGDGRREVAYVETPHIGGTLVLSRLEGGRLVAFHRVEGFSNHRIGAPELGLSAILDTNGDAVPDLIVPDNARTRLRVVTFAGGPMEELIQVDLGAEVTSSLQVVDNGVGRPEVALQLANGQVVGLVFGP